MKGPGRLSPGPIILRYGPFRNQTVEGALTQRYSSWSCREEHFPFQDLLKLRDVHALTQNSNDIDRRVVSRANLVEDQMRTGRKFAVTSMCLIEGNFPSLKTYPIRLQRIQMATQQPMGLTLTTYIKNDVLCVPQLSEKSKLLMIGCGPASVPAIKLI